jgi:hypothetical protein
MPWSFNQDTLSLHGDSIKIPYHSKTGLPIITTAPGIPSYAETAACIALPTKPSVSSVFPTFLKQNLTASQQTKLLLHEKCNNHIMSDINHWIRKGLLNADPSTTSSPDPICVACQYGKTHQKIP